MVSSNLEVVSMQSCMQHVGVTLSFFVVTPSLLCRYFAGGHAVQCVSVIQAEIQTRCTSYY